MEPSEEDEGLVPTTTTNSTISLTIRRRVWGVRTPLTSHHVPFKPPAAAAAHPVMTLSSSSSGSGIVSGGESMGDGQENVVASAEEGQVVAADTAGPGRVVYHHSDDRDIFDSSSSEEDDEDVDELLSHIDKPQPECEPDKNDIEEKDRYYAVMFAQPSLKKRKTWDEDGFLIISGSCAVLKNTVGEVVESGCNIDLSPGNLSQSEPFRFGGREVQIQEELKTNPFEDKAPTIMVSGRTDGSGSVPTTSSNNNTTMEQQKSNNKRRIGGEKTMFFSAMFAQPSMKKRKTWDEDGFLIISGSTVVLKNTDGRVIESSFKTELSTENISDARSFRLGSKEVQIQEELDKNPFGDDDGVGRSSGLNLKF